MHLSEFFKTEWGGTKKAFAERCGIERTQLYAALNGRGTTFANAVAISAASGGKVTVLEMMFPNGLPDLPSGAKLGAPSGLLAA